MCARLRKKWWSGRLMKQTQCSNVDLEDFELKGKTCPQIRKELATEEPHRGVAVARWQARLHSRKRSGRTVGRGRMSWRNWSHLFQVWMRSIGTQSRLSQGLTTSCGERDTLGIVRRVHPPQFTKTVISNWFIIFYFLRTVFDLPEDPSQQQQQQSASRAYVNKWRRQQERCCDKAFDKWVNECEGIISELSDKWTDLFSPYLERRTSGGGIRWGKIIRWGCAWT